MFSVRHDMARVRAFCCYLAACQVCAACVTHNKRCEYLKLLPRYDNVAHHRSGLLCHCVTYLVYTTTCRVIYVILFLPLITTFMCDDISLHVARSYSCSPDRLFSLISSLTLSDSVQSFSLRSSSLPSNPKKM